MFRSAFFQRTLLPFHLAWFETRVRYARSVLGPFWITLQTSIFVIAVGSLFANVFGSDVGTYMCYFSISYIIWIFFSGVILDSSANFSSVRSYILDKGIDSKRFILAPVARQLIYLAHTLIIPIVVFTIFERFTVLGVLMAIPGFILFLVFVLLITAPVSVFCVRFRDGKPIVESGMNLLFLLSPILWPPNAAATGARIALEINPIAHLLAIWREPLINQTMPLFSFAYTGILLLIAGILCYWAIKQTKNVPFWL